MTPVEEAAERARALADRRGLRIRPLREVADHEAAVALLCRVWGTGDADELVNVSLLRALAHSGNYVAGAYAEGTLVGAAVGFLGIGHLHSHITGVDRVRLGGGVGAALKQHQRAWALARGVDRICWTFDPLLGRNAHFNLHRLGAAATGYLVDFYGALNDGVNTGDPSDRLYVEWDLGSPAAVAAARGEVHDVDVAGAREAGAAVLVDAVADEPVRGAATGAATAVIVVPSDAEKLRARDPAAGARWRYAVREAFTGAFASGYRIVGVTRDGRYLLHRTAGPDEGSGTR